MEKFDLRLWTDFEKSGGDSSLPCIIDQIAIDSRRIDSSHTLFVALEGSNHDGHHFVKAALENGARYVLVKNEWPEGHLNIAEKRALLRVENPLKSFQDIAAAYRKTLSATVVGITGSFGKTLLKDLLYALVSSTKIAAASPESYNSQIGVALSLLNIHQNAEVALIEAGISRVGEMQRLTHMIAPEGVIVTTIGNAHHATLKSLQVTAQEKMILVKNSPRLKWSLLPSHPLIENLESSHSHISIKWDAAAPHFPYAYPIDTLPHSVMSYGIRFPDNVVYEGRMKSGYSFFLQLVNQAIKAAWLLGISREAICQTLENYQPEPMQAEIWNSPIDAAFINDAYGSDPQSVENALRRFDQFPLSHKRYFVFGGFRSPATPGKADFKRVGQALEKAKIDHLLLYGDQHSPTLLEQVKAMSPHTHVSCFNKYLDAVEQMRESIQQNDVILIKGPKKEPLETVIEAFHDSICHNQCLIRFSAIRHNIETLREKTSGKKRIMAIVKALAYGTDDLKIAAFLNRTGVNILGVSYVDEAVALKRAGVKQDLFVIHAAAYEIPKAVKWELQIGVSDASMILALEKEALKQKKKMSVHLHVNTGMSRFGCRPEKALHLAKRIHESPSLQLEGVMTHFASAENPLEDDFTYNQVHIFDEIVETIKKTGIPIPWIHAENSAAAIRFDLPQYNMIRIGLACYGLYPSEACQEKIELKLALSLVSHIVAINECRQGETISYGRTYTITRDKAHIAVLPIGYFDGLHRHYSGKGEVMIRGSKAPMIGKICMDYMMVDVSDIPEAQVGDSVLIFGTDEYGQFLSPEGLAQKGESIIHELVTCLGPRIQRIFIDE